jgi:hypothetical protein
MSPFASAALERAWRRAAEANVRYYRAVGRLYGDYVRVAVGLARGLAPSQEATRPVRVDAPGPPAPPPAPVLALEAEAGSSASGIFVVENRSPKVVSTPIEATALADREGRTAGTRLAFEPEVVTLAPGEQTLVQVSVPVDRTLRARVDYRGTLHVPGLPGTSIPIVVRRLPSKATSSPPSGKRGRAVT